MGCFRGKARITVWKTSSRSVGFAHGQGLTTRRCKNNRVICITKGRLKICVQVSDDLSYFRGQSPRYNLPVDWISDAQGRLKTQDLQSALTSGSLR